MDPLERLSLFQAKVQSEANRYTYEGITGAAEQIGALPERIANMQSHMVAIANQRMRAEQMGKQMQMQSQLLQLRSQQAQTEAYEAQTKRMAEQWEAESASEKQAMEHERAFQSSVSRYAGQWMPDGRGGYVMMSPEITSSGPRWTMRKSGDLPEAERAEAEQKGRAFAGRKEDPYAMKRMEQVGRRISLDELEMRRRIAQSTIDQLGFRKRSTEQESEYQQALSTMRAIREQLGETTRVPSGAAPVTVEETKKAELDILKEIMESIKSGREKTGR